MRHALISSAGIDTACVQLVDLANHRGGDDNITVVIAETDGEGLRALTGEERASLETVQSYER